eukprot:12803290-Alexandrium_andersonii.AAC.1
MAQAMAAFKGQQLRNCSGLSRLQAVSIRQAARNYLKSLLETVRSCSKLVETVRVCSKLLEAGRHCSSLLEAARSWSA